MKKIQLIDGMPASIQRKSISKSAERLLDEITEVCEKSGLSYKDINTALHIADEELYRKVLEEPFNK